jgi:hypothetical protein
MPDRIACQDAGCRDERQRLRRRLAHAEWARRAAESGRALLEQQLSATGNLCVALQRLQCALTHREVLEALQDNVINVFGSEELAVYERVPGSGELRVTQSFGLGPERLVPVALGRGPVGRAAEGQGWVLGDDGVRTEDPDLTAAVALEGSGTVLGVLAVWRLLAHKPVVRAEDRHVLELLGRAGGAALYLAVRQEAARAA